MGEISPVTQSILDGLIHFGRISHAYVFCGRADLSAVSRYLIHHTLCQLTCHCHLIETFNHPAVIWQSEEKWSVDMIRDLQKRVAFGPPSGFSRFFVVLQNADQMSNEAANAFLKTLEEPPNNVTFILLSLSKLSLMPTILSRSQILECHRTSQKSDLDIPNYLSVAEFRALPMWEKLRFASEWAQDKKVAKSLLEAWIEEISDRDAESLKILNLLIENLSKMKYNLNLRLQLENLVLEMS